MVTTSINRKPEIFNLSIRLVAFPYVLNRGGPMWTNGVSNDTC